MGIFKEEVGFFEDLSKRQTQIWQDSCDEGILLKDMSKDEVDRVREIIVDFLDLPGSELVWKQTSMVASQRQYSLIIMWGMTEVVGMYDATEIDILYFKNPKKEFFSINSSHVFTDRDGKKVKR